MGVEIPALTVPRVALVSGASSGIGKATAARLAALGSSVVVGYHSRRELAEEVVASLPGSGHLALRIAVDEAASITEAAAAVAARYGRLDALVNNGSSTIPVPLNDLDALTDELFDDGVKINLRGPFAMIRAFRPLLEKGEVASIVNISSVAAKTGVGSSLAYVAGKAGLDALTVALAKILAPKIRVFSILPAGVDTEFVPSRSYEQLVKNNSVLPLAHVTQPDDIARAVIACIVNLTSATGVILPVDEGKHL